MSSPKNYKQMQEFAKAHSLSKKEYKNIVKILDRVPNKLEIGIFSSMWSEHCSYKSSKKYLTGFSDYKDTPWVIHGPGENAGVIEIDDEYACVFKVESHNHPSFIEPFQGAATGVGGILRDVFTMGAKPIAMLNSLFFAPITKDKNDEISNKHKHLLKEVVKGISNYGNCVGVPTIGGGVNFNECYGGNNLVNAFALGLVKQDSIFLAKASGEGRPIIYAGSKTGRDGLGGAVMSSDSFDGDDDNSKKPTIQVGDPFLAKLLIEACLEMFRKDLIIGIQDMGAAGLTSSSFEMASNSKSGMRLYLDKVPAAEEGMKPYEFMLSESQERMLICAKEGKEQEVIDIFKKYQLSSAVIGEVTNTGNMELFWEDEKVGDIPIAPISHLAPVLNRKTKKPKYYKKLKENKNNSFIDLNKNTKDIQKDFLTLLGSIYVSDKSLIYEQYDNTVQTNTILKTNQLDATSIRIKQNNHSLSMSIDCNERRCYINPKKGAMSSVIEACTNVAMSGAVPKAVSDCLNYGSPLDSEVMWQFKQGIKGIKKACKALKTPVVSGNVSFYNQTNETPIYPTPTIVGVGVSKDANKILPSMFVKENSVIVILGKSKLEFGGSLYDKVINNQVRGAHPKINFDNTLKLWDVIFRANEQDLLLSAKDINVGGEIIALAKICASSNMGCDVDSLNDGDIKRNPMSVFCESMDRAIVSLERSKLDEFLALCAKVGIKAQVVGVSGGDEFRVNDINLPLKQIKDLYFNSFKELFA